MGSYQLPALHFGGNCLLQIPKGFRSRALYMNARKIMMSCCENDYVRMCCDGSCHSQEQIGLCVCILAFTSSCAIPCRMCTKVLVHLSWFGLHHCFMAYNRRKGRGVGRQEWGEWDGGSRVRMRTIRVRRQKGEWGVRHWRFNRRSFR